MATRTSFGASQSPEWQNGVLLLVTVPWLGFLHGYPEQRDNGRPLLLPDLPAQTGLVRAASSCF